MDEPSERRRSFRLVAHYMSVIFILPSTVLGGYLLGAWLDRKFEIHPWMTVLWVLLGSVAGFVEVFRILGRAK